MKAVIAWGVVILSGLFLPPLHGAENLFFKGTLLDPPTCTVVGNEGAVIDVSFGDTISIRSIDGVQNRMKLGYKVDCGKNEQALDMILTLRGNAASFDPAVLKTSMAGLGVRVLMQNKDLPINQPQRIATQNQNLEVVLVSEPGAILREGHFDARATLEIGYQ